MPGASDEAFKLVVPLDASKVKDFRPDRAVKVLAFNREGRTYETIATFGAKGKATAALRFDEVPGDLWVMVGPTNATGAQLEDPLPLCVEVPARQWQGERTLTIAPIVISGFYWWWWLAPPLGSPLSPTHF